MNKDIDKLFEGIEDDIGNVESFDPPVAAAWERMDPENIWREADPLDITGDLCLDGDFVFIAHLFKNLGAALDTVDQSAGSRTAARTAVLTFLHSWCLDSGEHMGVAEDGTVRDSMKPASDSELIKGLSYALNTFMKSLAVRP